MATQAWLGRFQLDSGSKTIDITDGTTPITITLDTSTNFYISGFDGETTQLCETIESDMQSNGGVYASATCSFSYDTGKVTFDFDGTSCTITWTDSDLQTILGFDGTEDVTSVTSATGAQIAKYVWIPQRGFSDHPVDRTQFWEDESMSYVNRSLDGSIASVKGQLLQRADVGYRFLKAADVIVPSGGEGRGTFELFFADVIHEGQHLRLFPDDSATTSSDYVTAIVGIGKEDAIGRFTDYASRERASFNDLWRVDIPLLKAS